MPLIVKARTSGKQAGSHLYFLRFERAARNGCASHGRDFQFNVDIFWLKHELLEESAKLPCIAIPSSRLP